MTPKELKSHMRISERIGSEDLEVAIKYAERMMAETLVDLGYSDAVVIYKELLNTYNQRG